MSVRLAKFLRDGADLLRRIVGWWPRRPAAHRLTRFRRIVIVEAGESTPALDATDALLVRSGARQKRLRFACPDGCGETITLDLSPTRYPHWSVEMHGSGAISVYPSVVNKRCGAHFLIRGNNIVWLAPRKGQG